MCEHLAYDEAILRERVASLEEDNAWARGLVVQTVATIADLTNERDRVRNDRGRLRAEFAEFYARMMMGERASAIRPDLAAARQRHQVKSSSLLASPPVSTTEPEGATCH